MPFPRRQLLRLTAGAAVFPLAARSVRAQAYPARPVRVVVPVAAGGLNDVSARLITQWLSEHLGQQFFVENRPGAGTNLGTETVLRAAPDGYTLLIAGSNAAINATVFANLPFNFIRDTVPIASIDRVPQLMQVNPSVPAKTVPEFIAYAKANPGKIAMGSGGIGSPAHVVGEYFKLMTGTELTHVPYRGNAAAYADLLSGNIQLIFADVASGLPHAQSGALRALGVTAPARLATLPDIPAIAETVPGYEANGWYGFAAPKNTPADVIAKLNAAINAGLADPELAARFGQLEAKPLVFTPQDYGAFLVSETERWGKAVKASGVRGD